MTFFPSNIPSFLPKLTARSLLLWAAPALCRNAVHFGDTAVWRATDVYEEDPATIRRRACGVVGGHSVFPDGTAHRLCLRASPDTDAPAAHAAFVHLAVLACAFSYTADRHCRWLCNLPESWLVLLALRADRGLNRLTFIALASAPLLQSWFAMTNHPQARNPYVLYAVQSRLVRCPSRLSIPGRALLTLADQTRLWSVGYAAHRSDRRRRAICCARASNTNVGCVISDVPARHRECRPVGRARGNSLRPSDRAYGLRDN